MAVREERASAREGKKRSEKFLKRLTESRFVVGNELIEINVDECVDFIASTVN